MTVKHIPLDDDVALLGLKANGTESVVRGFGVAGLCLRIGKRAKKWELRIENVKPAIHRRLGTWPELPVMDAVALAVVMRQRHKDKQPIDGPPRGRETISSVWPLWENSLITRAKGVSDATLANYRSCFNRLSDTIKKRPLRDLCSDAKFVEAEVIAIRARLDNSPRKGASAASQAARFISTLVNYARKRAVGADADALALDPCRLVDTSDPKRHDLAILRKDDMPKWYADVRALENTVISEALLFCLLSGLRRESLVTMKWSDLKRPILRSRAIRIPRPKGGTGRAFDLILSKPLLACLMRARAASRRLYPEHADTWVFAGPVGHMSGSSLRRHGVHANHSLRRSYATQGKAAGISKDSVARLLNHAGKDVTDDYFRESDLGELRLREQEIISAWLMKALKAKVKPKALA
jgi:integrase